MQNLEATKIARNIIREENENITTMYTNKYKNCRTVKANVDSCNVANIRRRVEAQIPGATVNIVKEGRSYYGAWSLLVIRIPYN
jgi:hypothetical protein